MLERRTKARPEVDPELKGLSNAELDRVTRELHDKVKSLKAERAARDDVHSNPQPDTTLDDSRKTATNLE